MRMASYNVENLFSRAKALNLETWTEGRDILGAACRRDDPGHVRGNVCNRVLLRHKPNRLRSVCDLLNRRLVGLDQSRVGQGTNRG